MGGRPRLSRTARDGRGHSRFWVRERDSLSGRASGVSLVDGDDGQNAGEGLLHRLFDADPERCESRGAFDARTLKRNPNRAVAIDGQKLHVPAIGNQGWANTIEPRLDGFVCGRR